MATFGRHRLKVDNAFLLLHMHHAWQGLQSTCASYSQQCSVCVCVCSCVCVCVHVCVCVFMYVCVCVCMCVCVYIWCVSMLRDGEDSETRQEMSPQLNHLLSTCSPHVSTQSKVVIKQICLSLSCTILSRSGKKRE